MSDSVEEKEQKNDMGQKENMEQKEKKYNDFYQRLRVKINRWASSGRLNRKSGKWTDVFLQYLLLLPDLVHLLIKMLVEKGIPARFKGYILIAFTYLLSPIDIIPDFIPVLGFVDDLLVLVIMLNKIINSAHEQALEKIRTLWAGEEDIFAKIKEIIDTMNSFSSRIPQSIYKFMKDKE
ncbi:MAG: DUF1232 domain-containing protein [Candidatus Aminicenantes bacterium]|nr:DUF1232 domain-containing protein [Candidatus Aminicenantes bacterium]